MISLNITKSSGETIRYPFDLTEGSTCRIGRDASCEISLPDETYLSRVHCIITYSSGQLIIQDNRSSNGVFFREQRIVSDYMHLEETYRLGECTLVAKQEQDTPAAYPQQASAYPQSYPQPSAYPQQASAYPQSYPQQASTYPQSYPQQATAYPQSYPQPSAYPQQASAYPQSYPQQASAYPQSYPQQASAYPQSYPQPSAYPQQASAYPQSYPQQASAYPQSYPTTSTPGYTSQASQVYTQEAADSYAQQASQGYAPAMTDEYSQQPVEEEYPQPEYPQPTAEDFAMADAMENATPEPVYEPEQPAATPEEPTPEAESNFFSEPPPAPEEVSLPTPPPLPEDEPTSAPTPPPVPEDEPTSVPTPPPVPEDEPTSVPTPPPLPEDKHEESKPTSPAPKPSAGVPISVNKEKKAPINLKAAAAALSKARGLKEKIARKGNSTITKAKAQVAKLGKRKEEKEDTPEVVEQSVPGNLLNMPYDFDLKARVVATAERFSEGVTLTFHINTAKDSRIILISHDSDDRPTLLLPGEKGIDTLAFSAVEARFPSPGRQSYDLIIEPPFGRETIVVLAVASTEKCECAKELQDFISKNQSKNLGDLEKALIAHFREKFSKLSKAPWSSAALHLSTYPSYSDGSDGHQGSFFHT